MPNRTPSPDTEQNPLDNAVAKPAGKGIETWLYPGRGVSVRYGAQHSAECLTGCAQVQVFAQLDVTARCEISFQTPQGEWRTQCIEGANIIVVGARVPHALNGSGGENVLTLELEPRFVHETAKADIKGVVISDLSVLSHRDALIGQLADAFRRLCCGQKRPTALYVECIGTVMATHVLHSLFGGEAPTDRRGGLPIEALQRVIAHIDIHYSETYDPDTLAQIAGFSRNHFCRLFEKSLAQTPRAFLRGCQVERAIEFLQTTDMKAIDIAQKCGFCDQTQMARWFWELRRIVPSEVRNAARG